MQVLILKKCKLEGDTKLVNDVHLLPYYIILCFSTLTIWIDQAGAYNMYHVLMS